MYITITLHLNEEYYNETYTETINAKPLKKHELAISIIVIVFFSVLIYFTDILSLRIALLIPILVRCYGIFGIFYLRRKWMSNRLKSNLYGKESQLTFTDTSIISVGPFSKGEILWTGIQSITVTDKGVILRPENGVIVYIPKKAFQEKGQYQTILDKIQTKK